MIPQYKNMVLNSFDLQNQVKEEWARAECQDTK